MHAFLEPHRPALRRLAERHGLQSIRVFGSMARSDADAQSDVDLLVEAPGLSGFALGALLMDAQDLLGRKVDIVTVNALHPAMRDRVLLESEPV
jgi:predicted nucleotidyltransferase